MIKVGNHHFPLPQKRTWGGEGGLDFFRRKKERPWAAKVDGGKYPRLTAFGFSALFPSKKKNKEQKTATEKLRRISN
jgi:hypothetical protein